MPPPVIITFLGTSSAVPSQTRNHSSLCLTLPSGSTFLFDAGEATQHQLQRVAGGFKLSSLRKVFITHMHGDHVFGLVPLLCTLLNGNGGSVGVEDPREAAAAAVQQENQVAGDVGGAADVEIYGPEGLREYVRSSLRLTRSLPASKYVVHELRYRKASTPLPAAANARDEATDRAPMELAGYNLFPDEDGYWMDIVAAAGSPMREWEVSAGSILHSTDCLGYVLTEPPIPGKITKDYKDKVMANKTALVASGMKNPMSLLSKVLTLKGGDVIELPDGGKLARPPDRRGRKVTILGDTYDPSAIVKLARGSDVLVHEATNAFLGDILGKSNKDWKEGETYQDVRTKTIQHGHSTPEMAANIAVDMRLGETGGVLGRVMVAEEAEKKGKAKHIGKPSGVLLLNHFSSRYADPRSSDAAATIMEAIRECAVRGIEKAQEGMPAQENSINVVCSFDLMQYEVKSGD